MRMYHTTLRLLRLRQPEQRFDRTRDDIELTVDRPTALTQFVDVGET